MSKVTIPKIRPASWKVYAQGEAEARHLGRVLAGAGIDVSEPELEPGLTDPPLYAIVATPKEHTPLTEEELVAILAHDDQVELTFESSHSETAAAERGRSLGSHPK